MSVKFLIIGLVSIYFIIGLNLTLFQNNLIFFPNDHAFHSCTGFKNYDKIDMQGTKAYFKQGSDNLIVYYHGNAGSACDRSRYKYIFESTNASILFVEYTGFSHARHSPSVKYGKIDVKNVIYHVNNNIKASKVIIYGQSIGAGFASFHASLDKVDALVLTSPFYSLSNFAQQQYKIYPAKLMLFSDLDNKKNLNNYQNRLLIQHGVEDKIINNQDSKKLFDTIPSDQKEYILIKGVGHNDIWFSKEFKANLKDFLFNSLESS